MKIHFPRLAALSALKDAMTALPPRAIKTALQNVLVDAGQDEDGTLAPDLSFSCTDSEIGVRVRLAGCDPEQRGQALLPAALLHDILSESRSERLRLEAGGEQAILSEEGGPGVFRLPSLDPSQFPAAPDYDATCCHTLDAGSLRRLLRLTTFAASHEGTRFTLNGSLWIVGDHGLRIVATDGRRLSSCRTAVSRHPEDWTSGQAVVPVKALKALDRLLADPEEEVQFRLTPNEAFFTTARTRLATLLVEGRFPPWESVLPKKTTASAQFLASAFCAAVRQAAVVAGGESPKVECTFGPGACDIVAESSASGSARTSCPLDSFAGPTTAIVFNPHYLAEFLRLVPAGDMLTVSLSGPKAPAVFHAGEDILHMIMPLT